MVKILMIISRHLSLFRKGYNSYTHTPARQVLHHP